MPAQNNAVEVAVFTPLRKVFHYLPPTGAAGDALSEGSLVKIPFGRGEKVGVVVRRQVHSELSHDRLKPINAIAHHGPVLSAEQLSLARWAADYYHHPLGDAIATMLPVLLRRGQKRVARQTIAWSLTDAGRDVVDELDKKAPRQAIVLKRVAPGDITATELQDLVFDWRRALRELEKKGFIAHRLLEREPPRPLPKLVDGFVLNDAQVEAVAAINASRGAFAVHLLHGVTGSGKTEVYMAVIERVLEGEGSALLLVPEIILTQTLVERLTQRFGDAVAVMHSGMSDVKRLDVWFRCRDGEVRVLMGTRSAVWAPLARLGVIIVDEEHDSSLKQHEGFRYSARDIAIVRAQRQKIPIVLGTATPSLESYFNVEQGKYNYLNLPQRAASAVAPELRCIDVRGQKLRGGLSNELCRAINTCLELGEQALLFLNRRGFAPLALCHQCAWIAQCPRCDANLVWHKARQLLVCHHCDGQQRIDRLAACCESPELIPIGLGTEQIEEQLREIFPERTIARIDRDSMRRKGAMQETYGAIQAGTVDILIGTQMLAKGHHFPNVTLVGIVDADSQLFSTDFRAEEKLAQTIVQVAGRAGRATRPGKVLIQTHHPDHALLRVLIDSGYDNFAKLALAERRAAELPPYAFMAIVRAEASGQNAPREFLQQLADATRRAYRIEAEILGPVPSAMERKAGRYRAQLYVTAKTRRELSGVVRAIIEQSGQSGVKRNVRWSIDVDPVDTL